MIFAVLRKPCAQLVGVAELDVVAVIRVAAVVLADDLEAVKRPGLQVLDGLLGRLLQLASRGDAHSRRVHEIDVGGRDGPRPRSGRGVGLGLAGLAEVNRFFSGFLVLRREDGLERRLELVLVRGTVAPDVDLRVVDAVDLAQEHVVVVGRVGYDDETVGRDVFSADRRRDAVFLVGLRRERADPAAHVGDVAAETTLLVEVVAEDERRRRRAFNDLERSAELSDVLLLPGTLHGLVVRRGRIDLDVLADGKILEHAALLVELVGVDAAHVIGVSGRDLNVGRGALDDGVGVDLLVHVGLGRGAPSSTHSGRR